MEDNEQMASLKNLAAGQQFDATATFAKVFIYTTKEVVLVSLSSYLIILNYSCFFNVH